MEWITQDTETLMLLKYFSIFRHPLTLDELLKFSSDDETEEGTVQYLQELKSNGTLKTVNDFYIYQGDESFVHKRLEGERRAQELMPKARKAGRLLSLFPFVKFVGISGSLSKGYADDKTDFDFFIITTNNTLWICRTILHLFKKMTFLVGKQHSFCMNYFIDEHHLEIEERNIFTRIELSTLIPVGNKEMYYSLMFHNKKNLPNIAKILSGQGVKADYLQQKIQPPQENNKWLKPLNVLLMKMTDGKWKRKWRRKNYPVEDYPLAFKTTPYVSKNHPKNYQKKILTQLQQNQS